MKNHERTVGWMTLWIIVFAGIMACCVAILGMMGNAYGQVSSFEAQWTYGAEPDVVKFELYWSEETGTYALGYELPIADYLTPPAWMTIPVSLPPGEYFFVVTAIDDSGNRSDNSNEAILHVQDVVRPSPCQGLLLRVSTP